MCGIAGIIGSYENSDLETIKIALRHRGPDRQSSFKKKEFLRNFEFWDLFEEREGHTRGGKNPPTYCAPFPTLKSSKRPNKNFFKGNTNRIFEENEKKH